MAQKTKQADGEIVDIETAAEPTVVIDPAPLTGYGVEPTAVTDAHPALDPDRQLRRHQRRMRAK